MTDDQILADYAAYRQARHYLGVTKKRWGNACNAEKTRMMDLVALEKKYGQRVKEMGLGKLSFNGRRCMHHDIEAIEGGMRCRKCGRVFPDADPSNNAVRVK